MTSIAVIGPGAIGGTVAAWLAQNLSFDLTLCARTPLQRLKIETPSGPIEAAPRIITNATDAKPVDWVLVATKAYDVEGAARWFKGLLGENTRIAVLQNGVDHIERFAPFVDPARIVPVIVDIPAERRGPGDILQRRLGTLIAPATANGEAFARLFARTQITASAVADFKTAAWRKLCLNCGGVVFALTQKPRGIAQRAGIRAIMLGLMEECAAVGRAEGGLLPASLPREIADSYRDGPADAVNSILADRLAGRTMEIDARNGVIVRLGASHAIPTPLNAFAVALLEAAQ